MLYIYFDLRYWEWWWGSETELRAAGSIRYSHFASHSTVRYCGMSMQKIHTSAPLNIYFCSKHISSLYTWQSYVMNNGPSSQDDLCAVNEKFPTDKEMRWMPMPNCQSRRGKRREHISWSVQPNIEYSLLFFNNKLKDKKFSSSILQLNVPIADINIHTAPASEEDSFCRSPKSFLKANF